MNAGHCPDQGKIGAVRRNRPKVSSPVYDQYQERTINLPSLGTTIASLARQRRRWETLLRSMPRTQSLARDFDPAFDHLTEVTGFGSNPGALRMFDPRAGGPAAAGAGGRAARLHADGGELRFRRGLVDARRPPRLRAAVSRTDSARTMRRPASTGFARRHRRATAARRCRSAR